MRKLRPSRSLLFLCSLWPTYVCLCLLVGLFSHSNVLSHVVRQYYIPHREIETLKKEKESDRIELEKRLEDAAKMLTTVLKPSAVKKEGGSSDKSTVSSTGKGFGNKRKSP